MPDPDLQELLEATARDDAKAFEQLYRQAAPRLFALVSQVIRREALAEEVLQESFVQIWREAHRYDARRAAPMTWMASIVRNRAIDELRRGTRERTGQDDLGRQEVNTQAAGPLEEVLTRSRNQALERCLNELTRPQREMIVLAFFRGMTHEQLADFLSIPLGSVKSWIRRGLEKLRICLQV